MRVTYADGAPVQEGDKIRHRQSSGGILAPTGWKEGVATKFPRSERELEEMRKYNEARGYIALDPDEIVLMQEDRHGEKRYYHLHGEVERVKP